MMALRVKRCAVEELLIRPSLVGGPGYTGPVVEVTEVRAAVERAGAAARGTAARLRDSSVAPEELAQYVPSRRGFLRMKPPTMRPLGSVWRLGSLLLDPDGALFALGHATRAAERGRPGYQSISREERREIAAAALRGGYAAGTEVNYDAVPIALEPASPESILTLASELPVGFDAGEVRVRWRAGAPLSGAPTLDAFLTERADLLIDPPFAPR